MKRARSILFLVIATPVFIAACVETLPDRIGSSQAEAFETPVFLSGEWEFYWNQLLTPDNFSKLVLPGARIEIPSSWHQRVGQSAGVATYRLRTRLSRAPANASIHFPAINSACRIWVNGVLMDSSGSIGIQQDYKAKIRSSTISLSSDSRDLEVIVQVANYTTLNAGIIKTPFVQNTTRMVRAMNIRHGIQNCLIGILLAIAIYQAILFFFHRDDRSFIVLAIICLFVAVRSSLVTGESQLLSELFAAIGSDFWFKLGFITVYSTLFLFPLYVFFLFPEFALRWPLWIYFFVSLILCIVVASTPHYVYGLLLDVYHGMMLTVFAYAIFSVTRAFRGGNEEARLIFWGVVFSFPFILLEMMQNSQLIRLPTGFLFLTETGVLMFLQFQVVLLSNRYGTSYLALKTVNQNLEVIVNERTDELVKANRVKDRLLSIVSHDIKSPLNALTGILNLFNKKKMSPTEFADMLVLLETELAKTSLLVENILSWTADQLKGVVIKKESFDLLQLLNFNIQLFQSALERKQISICHDLISNLQIETDQSILNTIIRNLLSNAIKFTPVNGKISIGVSSSQSRLLLSIQDDGVGMDDATLKSLSDPRKAISTLGTANERGTGLGIMLCHELLQKLNGELKIESQLNKGSRFLIAIPIR